MPETLITEIKCPICLINFNSHISFKATGSLVDWHVKSKHPEYLSDSELFEAEESIKYRELDVFSGG